MRFAQQPVVRVSVPRSARSTDWPMTIPAVAQLARQGLQLPPGVTFLVGENGSGKSTLVEAIAAAYGLSPEGGTTHGSHSTRPTESPLVDQLTLERGVGASRWGFFLRAETMHGWYTFREQIGDSPMFPEPRYHELSHGESFLAVIRAKCSSPGFYCFDEPEAALSFTSTLGLMSAMLEMTAAGAQVLCATHSPVLAALPGARILELGDWGLREAAWESLDLVWHWRRFLATPESYLRHLTD